VLKPVDETRMFEKLGRSLSETGTHEVHSIGFPSQTQSVTENGIKLHTNSTKPYGRFSVHRLIAPWKVFRLTLALKPEFLIITTHELLLVAMLCKLLVRCKLLYDVQENYFRNILYTPAFPALIRPFVAGWVRLKEILTSPFIHLFILAEKGYATELSFANPHIILQNKITRKIAEQHKKKAHRGYSKLLFTGTLAETTGLYHAIELARNLHHHDASITLTVIGACASAYDRTKLNRFAHEYPFIHVHAKPRPVPHKEILNEIRKADFGVVWYPQNPSTACSIPTKLFEYCGLNLPILIAHNQESNYLVTSKKTGLILKQPIDYQQLILSMRDFKLGENRVTDYWESDFLTLLPYLK